MQSFKSQLCECLYTSFYGKIYKWMSKMQLWTWPEYPESLEGVKWKAVINCPLSSFPNLSQCDLDNLESRVYTINDE